MSDQHAHTPQPNPQHDATLLSVNEVAVMLEVSKMTVYRLIASQLITAIRIGRANWIPRTSVYKFLHDTRPTHGAWTQPTPPPSIPPPRNSPHNHFIDDYSV